MNVNDYVRPSSNVYDDYLQQRNYSDVGQSTSSNKKTFLMLFAAVAVACYAGLGVFGSTGSEMQLFNVKDEMLSLWERECFTCTKCVDDRMKIISVAYGDKVVTGEFVSMYNGGRRNFPAGDSVWGETWIEAKKTMVLTFWMCDNFYTKVITEGQALVLP